MILKVIRTEEDYKIALSRLEVIFHSKKVTPEHYELDVLVMLIEKYETELVGEFPNPDPIEAIKFQMEQMELSQNDLAKIIGLKK